MVAQSNIVVDGAALWSDLMETAQFGATAKGGICRLALSGEDAKVRAWFKSTVRLWGVLSRVIPWVISLRGEWVKKTGWLPS